MPPSYQWCISILYLCVPSDVLVLTGRGPDILVCFRLFNMVTRIHAWAALALPSGGTTLIGLIPLFKFPRNFSE